MKALAKGAGEVIDVYRPALLQQGLAHQHPKAAVILHDVIFRRLIQSQAPGGPASATSGDVDSQRRVFSVFFQRLQQLFPCHLRNRNHQGLLLVGPSFTSLA